MQHFERQNLKLLIYIVTRYRKLPFCSNLLLYMKGYCYKVEQLESLLVRKEISTPDKFVFVERSKTDFRKLIHKKYFNKAIQN